MDTERMVLPVIPLTYSGCDLMYGLTMQYYEVKFTEDYGVFKNGEEVENLWIDFENGVIIEYDDNMYIYRKVNFISTPAKATT
jgi:hypothetical protein